MNQTQKNGKKPSFEPDLAPLTQIWASNFVCVCILPLLDVRHYCKLSLYAISKKPNEPN